MPEQITYIRPFDPLSLPETIELNFTDLGLLQIVSGETGQSYEQLIHIAIRELYLNRHHIDFKQRYNKCNLTLRRP